MRFSFLSVLIITTISLYSQNSRINCIVFIDGKLPTGIYDQYFSYEDSNGFVRKVEFEYSIGEIRLTPRNKEKFDSLGPNAEVTMNFSYKRYNGRTFQYSGNIKIAFLDYSYLVIRITNLCMKSGKYYFGYSTPGETMKYIKKEYNMFEEY